MRSSGSEAIIISLIGVHGTSYLERILFSAVGLCSSRALRLLIVRSDSKDLLSTLTEVGPEKAGDLCSSLET